VEEAELHLLGLGLNLGRLRYVSSDKPTGEVLSQNPKPGSPIRMKQSVDLWVASNLEEN